MKADEILKDLFFIERGYLNANHFFFRSEAPILIDTGYLSDLDATERILANMGVNLSAVSLIISTHTHCDHIGGNAVIQEKSGCDIALHRIGKYFVDTQDDWSTWWRYYKQEADFFTCTQALEDGDIIAIGPHEFQVIHTPGHASDGIVLYNRKAKILLSSDTLWENDLPVMTLRVEGSTALFQARASLEKLEALDVRSVYPGHGRPFNDFNKALSKSKTKIESYLRNRERVGHDLLKKIIVYTLLMKKKFKATDFLAYLLGTFWFKETIDLYFNSDYEKKYNEIMKVFLEKGVVKRQNGILVTTVKP